jgi:hypothetical protein
LTLIFIVSVIDKDHNKNKNTAEAVCWVKKTIQEFRAGAGAIVFYGKSGRNQVPGEHRLVALSGIFWRFSHLKREGLAKCFHLSGKLGKQADGKQNVWA